jgi:acetyltransferase
VIAHALDPLFRPRSIAVVGASASPGKAGNAMVRSLLGFPGTLHLVNPRASEIEGRPVVPSMRAIDDAVDLAVLVIPAAAVTAALEDCGRCGTRAAVVCAGGFAESADGQRLQEEALAAARRYGIRLLGPNTSGFMNPVDGVLPNFVPDVTTLPPGPLTILSSSGGVNLAASFLAADEGIGLRLGVGLGNAVDVDFAEVLDFLATDDATSVIGLHLEGVDDGRTLYEAIGRLTPHKPVVALKVGRSDLGDFAMSHTGRLLGDFVLTRAALRQAGAVLVDDLTELVDAVRALSIRRLLPTPRPGVGIVTAQAGPGLLIADSLRSRGVSIPELADTTVKAMAHLFPPLTWLQNPVDTGRPLDTFGQVLAEVAGDEAVDALLVYTLEESDVVEPEAAVRTPGVLDEVPVVYGSGGPRDALDERQRALAAAGAPLYRTPERAADAMRALLEDARARARRPAMAVPVAAAPHLGAGPLDEHDAKAVLREMGVATPAGHRCSTRAAAHAALSSLDGPVVVKVLDVAVGHKAEVGGVHVGVRDGAAMDTALDAIDAIPGRSSAGYLVEAQAAPGPELLVGGFRDASFGPTIALGRGGTSVEAYGPPAIRLAPLTEGDIAELVGEVDPDLDPALLTPVLRAVEALLQVSDVVEVDVNPVRLTPAGPVALDALVVRSS